MLKFYINSLNRCNKFKNKPSSSSNQIISTQNRITDNDLLEDPELHDYIKNIRENKVLSISQKVEIAQQVSSKFIDTLYELILLDIGHGDLHAKNMKISFKLDKATSSDNINGIEVFDWGSYSFGNKEYKTLNSLKFTFDLGSRFISEIIAKNIV